MIDRRTPPRRFRQGLLAVAVACAIAGPAAADPVPSRDYPPTYSSRKAPWYDPFGMFTSTDRKAAAPAQPTTTTKLVPATPVNPAPGAVATPAWKWYGYGTPTPGQNPLAPNGNYPGVPGNWYTSSGATPGAVPHGRVGTGPGVAVVPDPVPTPMSAGRQPFGTDKAVTAPIGPVLPNLAAGTPAAPPADVSWQSVPARIKAPASESFASMSTNDGPPAALKPPVPADDTTPSPPSSPAPELDDPRGRPPSNSPDLPIEPAADIVPPGGTSMSRATAPVIARGSIPDAGLPAAAIRRACGTEVRVMEMAPIGPKRVILRLTATQQAALAARDRLARVPELAGWHVEFELVTPVSR